jgi:hypothetical protein
MLLLYGGGAVICRELKIRWKKGMVSLLLLGAAYAVLEEGLMVASFQNPLWMDLGILGVFGRWIGLNWVWAVELIFYHSIISITVPVLIVELAYIGKEEEPWLSDLWFKIVLGLFLLDVIIGLFLFSSFTGFWPPLPQYLLFMLVTVVYVIIAHKLPSDFGRRGLLKMRRPLYYFVLTTIVAFSCGFTFWILPNVLDFPVAPLGVILIGISLVLGYIRYLISFDWKSAKPLHRFSIAAGSLVPLILSALIQEFDKSRIDDTSGMALVGITFIIGLLAMYLNLNRKLY